MNSIETKNFDTIREKVFDVYEFSRDRYRECILEDYFEKVEYLDQISKKFQFKIIIQDKKLEKIEISKINIIPCDDSILIEMKFNDDLIYEFKLELKNGRNVSNNEIKIFEDKIEIFLYFYKSEDEEDEKENFQKLKKFINTVSKKNFFEIIKKNSLMKILNINAQALYDRKLKHKILNFLKVFYFISFRISVKFHRMKKFHKKYFFHYFKEKFNNYKLNRESLIKWEKFKMKKFYFSILLKKIILTSRLIRRRKIQDSESKEVFFSIRRNLYSNFIISKLKSFSHSSKLKKFHKKFSNSSYQYLLKSKSFHFLKNKTKLTKIRNCKILKFLVKKRKIKTFYFFKSFLKLLINSKKLQNYYNKYNFYFFEYLIEKNLISLSDLRSSLNTFKINSSNLQSHFIKEKLFNQIYFKKINLIFNIIRSNYFKKKIIYGKFGRLYYKLITTIKHIIKKKIKKNFQISRAIRNFKLSKAYRLFEENFVKFKKEKISEKRIKNSEKIFHLKNNFFIFFKSVYGKINYSDLRKIQHKIIRKTNVKKNFKKFILFSQNNKKIKEYNKNFNFSPRNKITNAINNFVKFFRKFKTKKYFIELKRRSLYRMNITMNRRMILMKNKISVFMNYLNQMRFYLQITRIKLKNKISKIKQFFQKIKEGTKYKNYSSCADRSRLYKLKNQSFVLLNVYKDFRIEKRNRYEYFELKLKEMMKNNYLKMMRNARLIKQKESISLFNHKIFEKKIFFRKVNENILFLKLNNEHKQKYIKLFFNAARNNVRKAHKNRINKKKIKLVKLKICFPIIFKSEDKTRNLNFQISRNYFYQFMLGNSFSNFVQKIRRKSKIRKEKLSSVANLYYRRIFLLKIKRVLKTILANKIKERNFMNKTFFRKLKSKYYDTKKLNLIKLKFIFQKFRRILRKENVFSMLNKMFQILENYQQNILVVFFNTFVKNLKNSIKHKRFYIISRKIELKFFHNKIKINFLEKLFWAEKIKKFKSKYFLKYLMKSLFFTFKNSDLKRRVKKVLLSKIFIRLKCIKLFGIILGKSVSLYKEKLKKKSLRNVLKKLKILITFSKLNHRMLQYMTIRFKKIFKFFIKNLHNKKKAILAEQNDNSKIVRQSLKNVISLMRHLFHVKESKRLNFIKIREVIQRNLCKILLTMIRKMKKIILFLKTSKNKIKKKYIDILFKSSKFKKETVRLRSQIMKNVFNHLIAEVRRIKKMEMIMNKTNRLKSFFINFLQNIFNLISIQDFKQKKIIAQRKLAFRKFIKSTSTYITDKKSKLKDVKMQIFYLLKRYCEHEKTLKEYLKQAGEL